MIGLTTYSQYPRNVEKLDFDDPIIPEEAKQWRDIAWKDTVDKEYGNIDIKYAERNKPIRKFAESYRNVPQRPINKGIILRCDVNAEGHHLLFEETAVKSKISYLDYLLNKQRAIRAKTTITKTDYNEADNKGNYKKIETNCYSYPILDDNCFGMSIVEYRRKLNGELAEIRDRISTFNATQKVDYELPDGLL